MATPLVRRLPRELRHNFGRYLGIFLLMTISITLVSGFLAAASSIERITDGMRDAYAVEDGRFTTSREAPAEALAAVEDLGASVHENFSYDLPLERNDAPGATVRVHLNRNGFNEAAYAQGEAPQGADEIALDRTFAEHARIETGDTVRVGGRDLTVSGIMTLPDYAALFEKNSDFVMNTLTFGTAVVDRAAFASFEGASVSHVYSFLFDDRALPLPERIDAEQDIADALASHGALLTDLVDAASNQGITYAAEDVAGDQVTWETMLFLLIVIMAFVFVVLTSAAIDEESAVIGTLLASGYRKRELIAHYLALPCLVGLAAAVAGNVLGYTVMVDPMKGLYYNSYSLPPYVAAWSWRAFGLTTVIPFFLLMAITSVGLARKMRCTPLMFLRRETAKAGMRATLKLPERLGFSARFRLRVFLRNLSHFATLFVGITFASMLLLFGLCMMPTIEHYADSLRNDLVAEHQYLLKAPLEIDATDDEREAFAAATALAATEQSQLEAMDPIELAALAQKASTVQEGAHPVNVKPNDRSVIEQAEKFAAGRLETARLTQGNEEVVVYGIAEGSRYWNDVDVGEGKVAVGRGLAQKCGLKPGEPQTFSNKFDGAAYELTPSSLWGSSSCMAVFLSIEDFNELFGNDAGYFNGYVSNESLNLDERYLASDLAPADMDKISAQMQDSMGHVMDMMTAAATLVYLVLMYLLTKTVLDRSARSISYMKVFGYRNREINKLYLHSITTVVIASLLASLPLVVLGISTLIRAALAGYGGNMEAYAPADRLALIAAIGVATYAVVAFLHTRRIKRVPLALALKAQE